MSIRPANFATVKATAVTNAAVTSALDAYYLKTFSAEYKLVS